MADRRGRWFGWARLGAAALELEQARFGSRPLAGVRTGEPAQLGEFKRGQIDLQLGDLALEEGVVDQRPVAVEFGARDRLDALDAALRRGDPGDAGALVREQELGAGPALVLLIDTLLARHADILEELQSLMHH